MWRADDGCSTMVLFIGEVPSLLRRGSFTGRRLRTASFGTRIVDGNPVGPDMANRQE